MERQHVPGIKKGDILIYTLSTCGWCKKTKDFLDSLGLEYFYIDVDLSEGEAQERLLAEMKPWNPNLSFPTVIINNEKCIVGFNEGEIKGALNI